MTIFMSTIRWISHISKRVWVQTFKSFFPRVSPIAVKTRKHKFNE
ncbi:hypothetical protein LINPERPRIM_LOCUS8310 [Linum perenne]